VRLSVRCRQPLVPAAALGLLATFTLLSSCSADLPDGVFQCTNDDGCPVGWRCFSNSRCYSPSVTGLPVYGLCDVDEDCLSGSCVRAYDEEAPLGQCSESCVVDTDCPTVTIPEGDVSGVCARDVGCLAACTTRDDCFDPEAQSCVVAPMTAGRHVCVEFVSTEFTGRTPCTVPGNCPAGALCLRAPALDTLGVCVWPCSPGGPCPPGASCEELPDNVAAGNPMHVCLATCVDVPNSCETSMLSCEPFGSGTRHCVPNGWQ
jgi:hypothetical protein